MTRFLALYSGPTISSCELLAVTADPQLVREFGTRLFEDDLEEDATEEVAQSEERHGAQRVVAN